MDVTIAGVSDTLRELRSIDPLMRKEFAKDARRIAAPAITEIRAAYPEQILSGMDRKWAPKKRQIFPYDAGRARRLIGVKIDASRKAKSVISIVQKDAAASVVEFAGSAHPSAFARALSGKFPHLGRIAWPAAERKIPAIMDEMERSVRDVMNYVARKVA